MPSFTTARQRVTLVVVLDTNDALVDDNLVFKRKIGGQLYFWSFPAKKDRDMLTKLEALEKEAEVQGRKRESAEVSSARWRVWWEREREREIKYLSKNYTL